MDGARRLYDALKAQGGQELDPNLPAPPVPAGTLEETAEQLGTTQAELERTSRAVSMALGRQRGAGDPAALAPPAGGAGAGAGTAEPGVPGHLHRPGGPEGGQRPAPGALLSRAEPPGGGSNLARLTGEKYTALSLNRELEASAAGASDILPRRSLFLSKGTVDQIYLAVRLAVYDLCLKERHVPLVLDDALAAFDDVRMGRALELLLELSQEEQILFFTCQRREGAYLAGRAGVTPVSLSQTP